MATFRLVSAGKSVLKVVGVNYEDGQNVLVCGDFLVCWCGEVGVGGGCVVASLCMVPCSVTVGLGRLFAATVFTVPGRWHVTGCATGGAMSGSA